MKLNTFAGNATSYVDDKGRCAFPLKFRKALATEDGEGFMVIRYVDSGLKCLKLFTAKEWDDFENDFKEKMRQVDPEQKKKIRHALSVIKGTSEMCSLDGHNRISIDSELLEYAGIEKEVCYAADMGKTLTLWRPDNYQAFIGSGDETDLADLDDALNII
jgi:division/cell wall cluster transcriptional repressor MraZ